MFWGLIMEPQRRYSQKVKKSFHISMAALDISNANDEPAQIMCCYEGRNYLLCTLSKPDKLQCPLDLNFEEGSEISFASNGKCHVHLTGYLTNELDNLSELGEEEEEGDLEGEIEEEVPVPSKKKIKQECPKSEPPKKKAKLVNSVPEPDTEEEEDEDDESFDAEEEESDSSEDNEGIEAEDDGEEGEEEESSEEEEEVKPKIKAPKLNGIKKDKKQSPKKTEKVSQQENAKKQNETPKKPQKKFLQNGVVVEDLKEGDGPVAKNGNFINVYYVGRLKHNNKLFDETHTGPGFKFRLGSNEVIKGWDIGLVGMKQGGKRRITCPPGVAYGQKGSPPVIPPNSTLVFEVDLKKVK